MKKALLFCSLLCCVFSTQAQPYQPMLRPGREWLTCNWTWLNHYMDYYQLSDTTTEINGQHYYTLNGTTYGSTVSYRLREDSAAKKVWIMHGSQENLLYDFSLTAGDTMVLDQNAFVVLTDTILVSVNDTAHKLHALQLQTPLEHLWLVEGVGLISPSFPKELGGTDYGINDMLVPDSIIHTVFSELFNTPKLYNAYDTAGFCPAALGVKEIPQQPAFSLSPNPSTNGCIRIQFAPQLGDKLPYRISTIDGRLMQQGYAFNNIPLNISLLPAGIYTIQLLSGGIPATKRFVIL